MSLTNLKKNVLKQKVLWTSITKEILEMEIMMGEITKIMNSSSSNQTGNSILNIQQKEKTYNTLK